MVLKSILKGLINILRDWIPPSRAFPEHIRCLGTPWLHKLRWSDNGFSKNIIYDSLKGLNF